MSIKISLAVFASLLACAQPQTGALTGRVVNSVTNAPVAHARITVLLLATGPRSSLQTRTNQEGVYTFPTLIPGRYALGAERNGYLGTNATGATNQAQEIKAGETTTAKDVALAPQAVIQGRVVDSDGEPVEQAQVQLLVSRRGRLVFGAEAVQTDDRGEFRIAKLSAGAYTILVSSPANRGAFLDGAPGQRQMYIPTYFPSATRSDRAVTLRVSAGEERSGVEVRLQRSESFRVSGIVSGEMGDNLPVQVMLQPVDTRGDMSAVSRNISTVASPQSGGRFLLDAVPPGEYVLAATTPIAFGTTRLRVGQHDVNDVAVWLRAYMKVEGKLRRAGASKPVSPHSTVGLLLIGDQFASAGSAQVLPDGSFRFDRVAAARYLVIVNAEEGWIAESVTQAGQTSKSLIVDLSAGPAPFEVTMHNRPARIDGSVETVEESKARLVAVAFESHGEDWPPALLAMTWKHAPVRDNKFQIPNLRAAKYKVFVGTQAALELMLDPANTAKLAAKATEVTLAEGVTLPISLRPITEKDVDQN